MKVLHVTNSDGGGGAAIGAYRLHQSMRRLGVESEMLVLQKTTTDPTVHALLSLTDPKNHRHVGQVNKTFKQYYGDLALPIRTFNLAGVSTSAVVNDLAPDVVQFHWIANNTIRIDDIRNIAAPIVWKLPDMWAFSGGEHYSNADEPQRHLEGYDVVPPFRGEAVDVDRFIWEVKRHHFSDLPLTIVAPSRFLATEAHKSALLSRYDSHVIPNPLPQQFLDCPRLTHDERAQLRERLGLPREGMLAIFAVFDTRETRKGYHHLEAMVRDHLPSRLSPDDIRFLVIGSAHEGRTELHGYDLFLRQNTTDQNLYRDYLLAADILLFPSEMDNSAMAVQEALACGRPAITFAVGGHVDMVHHLKSGYLATFYRSEELADGLAWWLGCEDKEAVENYCRARARAMHPQTYCVESYMQLYETVLGTWRRGDSFKTGRLFDREVDNSRAEIQRRVLILDPSIKDLKDSSHNTEVGLAFYALFEACGLTPTIVANKAHEIPGDQIRVIGGFDYTAYDKLRSTVDKREGVEYHELAALERASSVRRLLNELVAREGLTARDAVLFPMTDRPLLDGLLLYLATSARAPMPSFHLNLMFEKAKFLVGGYPLSEMLLALKNSGHLGRHVFLYAETAAMAAKLREEHGVEVSVLRPPSLLSPAMLRNHDDPRLQQLAPAYDAPFSLKFPDHARADGPSKKSGEYWVSALGRGRRDKGWAELPEIVRTFNQLAPDETKASVKFIVQMPRAMDKLDDELAALSLEPNVVLFDELISNEELSALTDLTDLFLLPYKRDTYGSRGSAFVWRAVAQQRPLLVSAGTALAEAIEGGNGLACSTSKAFAEAIANLHRKRESMAQSAKDALRNYVEATVHANPVVKRIMSPWMGGVNQTLYITERTAGARTLVRRPGDDAVVQVETVGTGSVADDPDGLAFYPSAKGGPFVRLTAEQPDEAGLFTLPDVVTEAIAAGRFRRIVVDADADWALAASEAVERAGASPHIVTLAARSEPTAKAPDSFDGELLEVRQEHMTMTLELKRAARRAHRAIECAHRRMRALIASRFKPAVRPAPPT